MTVKMNVFTLIIVSTSLLMAASELSRNPNGKPDATGLYNGRLVKWAVSAASASNGESKGLSVDFICDGSGECREKMSKAIGKAKDTVTETAQEAGEVVDWKKAAALKTGEAIGDAFQTAKHLASEEADDVKEKVTETRAAIGEALDWTKKSAREVGDAIKRAASQKGRDVKETVDKAVQKASSAVGGGANIAKEQAKATLEKAKEGQRWAEETAVTVGQHVSRNVSQALNIDVTGVMASNESESMATEKPTKHDRGSMAATMGLVNLLGFASAYGVGLWVTLLWSPAFKSYLPRQQLEMVESKMYNLYFRTMVSSTAMALLGHWLGKKLLSKKAEALQSINLFASLLMVLLNLTYLKPLTDKLMHERMKLEKEEEADNSTANFHRVPEPQLNDDDDDHQLAAASGRADAAASSSQEKEEKEEAKATKSETVEQLNKRLKKLNSFSSFFNIMTLLALTWHLDYLCQRLNMTL